MEIKSVGTNADLGAKVDIAEVHRGYFSNEENLDIFIKLGLEPIIVQLPQTLSYVDFGGGQGQLTAKVKKYLEHKGFAVKATVADANENFLAVAQGQGLKINLCNLGSCGFSDIDLITMRAVLHYNPPADQLLILQDVYRSLKPGAYFVHQNSSGNKENCELRSEIVNIPELGRAGAGNYHWVSENEQNELLKKVGFTHIISAGYATPGAWSPEEQWDRFNKNFTGIARASSDTEKLAEIENRRKIYLSKANKLIETFVEKYGAEYLGVKKNEQDNFVIEYPYPIVIARK